MSNSNLPIQNQDFGCKVLHVSFYTTHRKTLLINNLQKIEIDKSKTPPWHHRSIWSCLSNVLTSLWLSFFVPSFRFTSLKRSLLHLFFVVHPLAEGDIVLIDFLYHKYHKYHRHLRSTLFKLSFWFWNKMNYIRATF